jgi:tRNA pseudouridine38-40 synthase
VTRNIRLTLEYDGTAFHGFQRQPRLRTVQGVLEERFSRALKEPIGVIGAGRTDAGVHAVGQVANFRTTRPVPTERLARVLNAALPADVKALACEQVGDEFHARRCARSRTYRYTIIQRATPSPLLGRYALLVPGMLSVERMSQAARPLLGRHDFGVFQASGSETATTERTLMRLECERDGDRVTITAEADSFLYQMVRVIVSGLLAVGRGWLEPEALATALGTGERPAAGRGPAAARGLCLVQISYGDSPVGCGLCPR